MTDIAPAPVATPNTTGPMTSQEAFQDAPADASALDTLMNGSEQLIPATTSLLGETVVASQATVVEVAPVFTKLTKIPTVMPPDPKPFPNYHGGGVRQSSGRLTAKAGFSVRNRNAQ